MADGTFYFDKASIPDGIVNNNKIEIGKASGILGFMKVPPPLEGDTEPPGNWFKLKFSNFNNNNEATINAKDLKSQAAVNLNDPSLKEFIVTSMIKMMNEDIEFTNIEFKNDNGEYIKSVSEPILGGKKRRSKTSNKRNKNRRSKKSRK